MARALAVKLDADPIVAEPSPSRRSAGQRAAAENARILQQRLHDAYAPLAIDGERELSPFARLMVIVGASGLLWAGIAVAVNAVI